MKRKGKERGRKRRRERSERGKGEVISESKGMRERRKDR